MPRREYEKFYRQENPDLCQFFERSQTRPYDRVQEIFEEDDEYGNLDAKEEFELGLATPDDDAPPVPWVWCNNCQTGHEDLADCPNLLPRGRRKYKRFARHREQRARRDPYSHGITLQQIEDEKNKQLRKSIAQLELIYKGIVRGVIKV